jgi:tRNA pseudouridine55 synthase
MAGLLNLNKPEGMTSRDAVNRAQKLIRPVKVGHAGTLDPFATGVLVLCLGKATRLIQYIQDRPKTYLGTFELGTVSTTCDREGELTETGKSGPLSAKDMTESLPQFLGNIEQVPPRFSAVHVNGKRAYDLARQDQDFQLDARTVFIESLELTDWSFPRFSLKIVCGSGTYIRSLGRDLGESLGCGAYMTDLTRTAIGEFQLDHALSVEQLTNELIEEHLVPPGEAVRHLPRAITKTSQYTDILNGKQFVPLLRPESISLTEDSGPIAVYDESDQLVCLAEPIAESDLLKPRHVFPTQP